MNYFIVLAEVAKLADALDSKSSTVLRYAGSSPAFGIRNAKFRSNYIVSCYITIKLRSLR